MVGIIGLRQVKFYSTDFQFGMVLNREGDQFQAVQIGKDFYEDLTADKFEKILKDFDKGVIPKPGPQNGRYAAEPLSGLTTLHAHETNKLDHNASVGLAIELKDTIERIGTDKKVNSKKVKK